MTCRIALTALLVVFVPLAGHAAEKKKKPLSVVVTSAPTGLPLITLTASNAPVTEIAARLAKGLSTTVEVSVPARALRVTTAIDRQPLDLTLRELAPQSYLDGVLSGGNGKLEIRAIHLLTAGEPAPSLADLQRRGSEVIMFFGHTEEQVADPFEGKLQVTHRNGRLRVFARSQPVSVVVSQLAEALGIPLELIGDSLELIDVSVNDATLEQTMRALPSSVQLYQRMDLANLQVTPVRLVVQVPFEPATDKLP